MEHPIETTKFDWREQLLAIKPNRESFVSVFEINQSIMASSPAAPAPPPAPPAATAAAATAAVVAFCGGSISLSVAACLAASAVVTAEASNTGPCADAALTTERRAT